MRCIHTVTALRTVIISQLQNEHKKGYLSSGDDTRNESYNLSRSHEWSPQQLLVLLTNSGYRQQIDCIVIIVRVCYVVSRVACAEKCANTQKKGEDSVYYANYTRYMR
jgi:hypothetical protein